jgi:multiple sugar transport system substrate-binding protein
MTLLGSVSPCKRTYENYEVIDTYPWLTLSKDAINTSVTVRTPGEDDTKFDERRFLSILGMAVNNAYNAAMTEAEALAFAQGIYLRTMK